MGQLTVSDENNDQSDEESESESEHGQDPNDDTQESDNIFVNNNASSDSGDENDPVPALGTKRKQKVTKTSSQKKANRLNKTQNDEELDDWIEIASTDTNDLQTHKFRFIPSKEPGVYANIDGNSKLLGVGKLVGW